MKKWEESSITRVPEGNTKQSTPASAHCLSDVSKLPSETPWVCAQRSGRKTALVTWVLPGLVLRIDLGFARARKKLTRRYQALMDPGN